mmetsp:Transcript_110886/g.345609  ORF Transcript_110886/g.345609 Transcript_110886/m.345609 type:complete len:99 (-) Transcript_110886:578-874(-)
MDLGDDEFFDAALFNEEDLFAVSPPKEAPTWGKRKGGPGTAVTAQAPTTTTIRSEVADLWQRLFDDRRARTSSWSAGTAASVPTPQSWRSSLSHGKLL